MSGEKNRIGGFVGLVVRSLRGRRALVAIVVTAALCLGAVVALRATQNPYEQKGQAPAAKSGGGGSFSYEQLGDALDSFGKNSVDDNGNKYYSINTNAGQKKIQVIVSISPNGHVIWINSDVADLPSSGNVSSSALMNLLKKNTDIGPTFFSIHDNSLALQIPVANFNMSADTVQAYVNKFISTVRDNASLFSSQALGGR